MNKQKQDWEEKIIKILIGYDKRYTVASISILLDKIKPIISTERQRLIEEVREKVEGLRREEQKRTVGEERRGLRAKIIGFTAFPDGQDKDCIAITDDGKEIIVDPFVGCSWEYEKRQHLLNEWFEDPEAFLHKNEDQEVWLTGEHSFRLVSQTSAQAQQEKE